jgi:hypothetical protein
MPEADFRTKGLPDAPSLFLVAFGRGVGLPFPLSGGAVSRNFTDQSKNL